MAFITPYVTGRSVTYKGDVITTLLSAAIWLSDDFTGNKAVGNIRVMIKETSMEAVKNLSGYYVFTNLVSGNYTVDISSDLYFPEEIVIDTSKIKISNEVLNFDTKGPASGATSIKLKAVSTLQKWDIIEFRNPHGDVEQKNIISINTSKRTISCAEGLKSSFNTTGSTILALKNPVISVLLKPLPSYPFPNNATLVRGLLIDSSGNPVGDASVKVISQNVETKSDKSGEFVLYFNNFENKQITIKIEMNGNTKSIDTNFEEGMTKSLGKIVFP